MLAQTPPMAAKNNCWQVHLNPAVGRISAGSGLHCSNQQYALIPRSGVAPRARAKAGRKRWGEATSRRGLQRTCEKRAASPRMLRVPPVKGPGLPPRPNIPSPRQSPLQFPRWHLRSAFTSDPPQAPSKPFQLGVPRQLAQLRRKLQPLQGAQGLKEGRQRSTGFGGFCLRRSLHQLPR